MTLLAVEHVTHYRYAAAVELAHHVAYLRPSAAGGQQLESFDLAIEPPPAHRRDETDAFGNHRLAFTLAGAHRALSVRMRARVRVPDAATVDPAGTQPWEAVRERLRFAAGAVYEPASQFAVPSPYVPRLAALRDWAAPSFMPGTPVAAVAVELMARLHREFAYRSESTTLDTPLADVLARREGVCQDFAHLMIGALRMHGLAARYVSGYLLTTTVHDDAHTQGAGSTAPLLGADASHAWLAVWCPRTDGAPASWLELDPTNNLLPGQSHVRLGIGRDYGDVTPLRGVIRGGGEHRLTVEVRTQRVAEAVAEDLRGDTHP
jgi:transglutaminase-like putative cysteine protease